MHKTSCFKWIGQSLNNRKREKESLRKNWNIFNDTSKKWNYKNRNSIISATYLGIFPRILQLLKTLQVKHSFRELAFIDKGCVGNSTGTPKALSTHNLVILVMFVSGGNSEASPLRLLILLYMHHLSVNYLDFYLA